VRIYLLNGEPEQALDQPLLRVPFYLSAGWLRIDPTFDPLRSNPRFRKLVAVLRQGARVPSNLSRASVSGPLT
jgi:hypothetical protein